MSFRLLAEQKNLVDILSGELEFEIPDFQRSYSWGYKECNQLYRDIFEMFQINEEFFLGNIVTARSDENIDKIQIVDGQQRITTLLLWIKALELIYEQEFSAKHRGLYKSLYKEDWESSKTKIRLKSCILETDDNKNLKEILAKEFTYEKANELLENYLSDSKSIEKIIQSKFKINFIYFYKWSRDDFKDNLKDFIIFLLKKIILLPMRLEADTESEAINKALVIFETINNRGLPLEDSDIFKSKLHQLALKKGEKEIFINRWIELREIVDNLGLKIDDIFGYYSHIIRGREKITSQTIKLRDFFTLKPYSPLKNSDNNYDIILDELNKIVNIYAFIDDILLLNVELCKWFQLIEKYTNQFPKIALVVYIYKLIEDELNLETFKQNIMLDKQSSEELKLIEFCKKIVRYIYFKGATTTVKTEIYKIIKNIMWSQEIDNYYNSVTVEHFDYLGKLRNSYALLAYYLDGGAIIHHIKYYKIMPYQTSCTSKENSKLYNCLGNLIVKNAMHKVQKIDDLNILINDEKMKKIIVEFIKGER